MRESRARIGESKERIGESRVGFEIEAKPRRIPVKNSKKKVEKLNLGKAEPKGSRF